MKKRKNINVLIVDDHPIIINAYINALNSFSKKESLYNFTINSSKNIVDALRIVDSIKHKIPFDLLLLDISLPKCSKSGMNSGEDLGKYIKSKLPSIKIIAITSLNDNFRLINIIKKLNPDGLIIKSDLENKSLLYSIDKVLKGEKFYSGSINHLLSKRLFSNHFILDDLDLRLLRELSNGAKLKELENIFPLTKSGIDKRKRILKDKFGILTNSDRDLVLAAKEKGVL